MLKNDYLVAKIGVDTAENEPRIASDVKQQCESEPRPRLLQLLAVDEAVRSSVVGRSARLADRVKRMVPRTATHRTSAL